MRDLSTLTDDELLEYEQELYTEESIYSNKSYAVKIL
jgi:hypothetical protein